MAVREFTDDLGHAWRAWDIKPEAIHPQTKAEDYLADCYTVGWIVFERATGEEKRRLCPYPVRWADASEAELRTLLGGAEVVPAHKLHTQRQAAGESAATADAPVADARPDITDLEVVRSFRYPGGRLWTVCVVTHPDHGGPAVLRFTAGMRWLDLKKWPRDWADARDDVLVDMLRRAAPRADKTPVPGTPRRRWNDLPEYTSGA
jgi:hypothetical protein